MHNKKLQSGRRVRCAAALFIIAICAGAAFAQTANRDSITLRITDEQGGVIIGAQVKLKDISGRERSGTTNEEGKCVFSELMPGDYAVRVAAEHFKAYENQHVLLIPGSGITLGVTLGIAAMQETISVFPDTSLAQFAEYTGGSLVFRGDALMALEGPGGLEAFLRALSLRTSGPFGPVALVNGFEDGQLPPTYSIREIRINDNPFSAEYATLGLGRIEILTKPGTEKLHFATFAGLGNANWNSRNPFALDKVPYHSRLWGGNISGPISSKRATFFIDFTRQQVDTNAVINATTVDQASRIIPLRQAVVTPQLRKSFSPRLDYQMGTNHTWVLRYGDTRFHTSNSDVGALSLLSQAQDSNGRVQTFQLAETAVLNSKVIDETRAQYVRTKSSSSGNNSAPTINVPGAFIGGGAAIGSAYNRQNLTEVQNLISWQTEKHAVKAGLQGRNTQNIDGSTQNFGGTYTFASRIGPELDSSNKIITDAQGTPIPTTISTIEAYRRTLLFGGLGLSPQDIRARGGGASQFSITSGDIGTSVSQYQAGAFIQDSWRLLSNFTLNSGIRYERQGHVSRKDDFAPRLGFAWGIGGGKSAPRTVVRGGAGIFYDRIGDSVILRAKEMDGVRQRQYLSADNSILDLFPLVPSRDQLTRFAVPQSTVRLAGDLRDPYSVNSSLSVERQLVPGLSVALTASSIRSVHLLRSRNINAPYAAIRPFGTSADIFQYESSGVFNERQLLTNVVYRAGRNVTIWSTYTLADAKSDTESPDSFPANSYDLRGEYGRSATLARHTFYWGGWIHTKGGIDFTPLVLWRSPTAFDITTGRDANGDSLFTDRPAFATDLQRPSVVVTQFGTFDVNPTPGQTIIPRNFGYTPKFFIVNLRVSKKISLRNRTSITVSVQGSNIFNHTNAGSPIGNLGSPLFGISNSSAGDWGVGSNQAGNRRLEAMVYFAFD